MDNIYVLCALTVLIIVVVIIIPALIVLKLLKKYDAIAISLINKIIEKHSIVNGDDDLSSIEIYFFYGVLHWTKEVRLKYNVSKTNVDQIILLCNDLKAFSYKWGILAKGGFFSPIIVWWNFRKYHKFLTAYKRSV